MCPTKPRAPRHPLHHVVQDAGQEVDDPVAVVVAVAVVELLEVIEVGVADRELLGALQPAPDLALDLGGARAAAWRDAPRRRARSAPASPRAGPAAPRPGRARSGPRRLPPRTIPGPGPRSWVAGERSDGHDGGEGIALEAAHQLRAPSAPERVGIDEEQAGVAPQHDRLDLVRLGERPSGNAWCSWAHCRDQSGARGRRPVEK